jgi:UDP-N-acetyl-D-mannosaminuronic acid dehydrogenase
MPILEKKSGLKAGVDFFVAFAPERTVEGRALEELRKLPQIIGGINWVSTDLVANIFNHLTHSVVLVESLEEAEMVKLVNNVYRDVTFAFANELSLICHKFGINTHRVIEAANKGYERGQVPLPSPCVGGVCLEKDPFLFIASAKKVKYIPKLASHARSISEAMVDFVAAEINSFLKKKKKNNNKILILGAAFKGRPATSDIRGSTTIGLIARLNKCGIKNIHVNVPMVNGDEISSLGVKYTEDLMAAFTNADAVVVMNNNPAFEDLNLRQLLALARNTVLLFDTWGLYKEDEIKKIKGVEYKRL